MLASIVMMMKNLARQTKFSVQNVFNLKKEVQCTDKIIMSMLSLDAEQDVPKNPQTIENNLLLEFQWPNTKLNPRVHKLLT